MKLLIKQKYFSFRDKFTITDENGQPWFYVEGNIPFFSRKKIHIYDMNNNEVLMLQSRFTFMFLKFDFFRPASGMDQPVGLFKEKMHFPFTRRFRYSDENGEIAISGSFIGYNWKIKDAATKALCGTLNKKFFKIADTYTLDITDDTKDPALMLAFALLIDLRHHTGH